MKAYSARIKNTLGQHFKRPERQTKKTEEEMVTDSEELAANTKRPGYDQF